MARTVPDPGFAGDDGSAPAALVAALEVYAQDPEGGHLPALAALGGSRVLVPVVALGEESTDVDMATVLMKRPDGRTALLAFSSTTAMAAWDPSARPVPVAVATAAASAVQEGADALLVDVAGPVRFAAEDDDLHHLARGHRLVRITAPEPGWGWLDTAAG